MHIVELILIAVGLAMDAFAVAVCKGLSSGRLLPRHYLLTGLWFGGAQALMPTIGYLLGAAFSGYIEAFDHWIAFILLALIGFNMLREGLEKNRDATAAPCGCGTARAGVTQTETAQAETAQAEAAQAGATQAGATQAEAADFSVRTMLLLAVATSIDALAAGISFALLPGVSIGLCAALIGGITFGLSALGLWIGRRFGLRFKARAEIAGGCILVLMGLKILLEHLGVLPF